jgi:hypothetical protein
MKKDLLGLIRINYEKTNKIDKLFRIIITNQSFKNLNKV